MGAGEVHVIPVVGIAEKPEVPSGIPAEELTECPDFNGPAFDAVLACQSMREAEVKTFAGELADFSLADDVGFEELHCMYLHVDVCGVLDLVTL